MAERMPALLVTDPEKAAEFYVEVFGITVEVGTPEWILALGTSKVRLIEPRERTSDWASRERRAGAPRG